MKINNVNSVDYSSVHIVDAHCDTLLKCFQKGQDLDQKDPDKHIDILNLQKSGVLVQFFAVFVETDFKPVGALRRTLQIIDYFTLQLQSLKNKIILVKKYEDIIKARQEGKIAAVLTVEGGEALEGDLSILRILYSLGVRSMGLTWNNRNLLADGVEESSTGGGLTTLGVQVIKEMNRIGMVVDFAHLSERGFWNALEVCSSPPIVSHANCRTVYDHPRNLSDEQIKGLAEKEGILGLTFAPSFLCDKAPDAEKVVDHIDHACSLVGTRHVAIGSDFDGIAKVPVGLENAGKWGNLIRALLKRGYKFEDIKRIMGNNMLELLKKILI